MEPLLQPRVKPLDFDDAFSTALSDLVQPSLPDPTWEKFIQAATAHLPRSLTAEEEKHFRRFGRAWWDDIAPPPSRPCEGLMMGACGAAARVVRGAARDLAARKDEPLQRHLRGQL